jgi:DDE superfamily endonuclease
LREWWTRDHLSAISAISLEGKLYFHSQDHPVNSDDVVGFLEHLLREVPGRMVLIWDGAPIHRSQVLRNFLANGAAQRLHLERLPQPMRRNSTQAKRSGNSSKGSNCAMSAASIFLICGANYVTP